MLAAAHVERIVLVYLGNLAENVAGRQRHPVPNPVPGPPAARQKGSMAGPGLGFRAVSKARGGVGLLGTRDVSLTHAVA